MVKHFNFKARLALDPCVYMKTINEHDDDDDHEDDEEGGEEDVNGGRHKKAVRLILWFL